MLSIEVVRRADQRRRWHEIGRVLFAGEPRWAPPLLRYERWLFSRRHPYRRATGAEVERWLARRGGAVVGRIAAHRVDGDDVAWFGGLECADDAPAVAALVDAAREWAGRPLRGPALYLPADGDAGVLTAGFEHPGGTGRSWHPPWYAAHLAAAGLVPDGEPLPRWRLSTPTGVLQTDVSVGLEHTSRRGVELPPHAGRLADPALVLSIPAGEVAAVPDVSAALRRADAVDAAVVRCEGDPAILVPALLAAAAERGYAHVWAPWTPERRPPDTVHELVADRNRLP